MLSVGYFITLRESRYACWLLILTYRPESQRTESEHVWRKTIADLGPEKPLLGRPLDGLEPALSC